LVRAPYSYGAFYFAVLRKSLARKKQPQPLLHFRRGRNKAIFSLYLNPEPTTMFMKPALLFIFSCFVFLSCTNTSNTAGSEADNTVRKDTLSYPFKAKYSINWRPGNDSNALLVLNCLKKYVAGDVKGCVAYFADTAEFIADKFHFSGSRDSLEAVIGAMRGASASVSKEFDSWMTLYYPDKDANWVTLWYTEKMTDKQGKTDSIYYTDDVLVKNGKIQLYDEKQRLFPDPKK